MSKKGQIIIIDDDLQDLDWLAEVFSELNTPNEILYFTSGKKAFEYFTENKSEIFLILSDIVMINLDGFKLREMLYEHMDISFKNIPYVFFTTYAERKYLELASDGAKQGYFVKPENYDTLKYMIKTILDYWKNAESLSTYDD